MKALTFSSFGGPEVLDYIDVPDPVLKPDEILVKTEFIGLNYADIYRRKGNYHLKGDPPYIAGYEAAGIVVDANGVANYKPGDRVGFADVPYSNAELVAVPANHAILLPAYISTEVAASVLLQGLTAQYLAEDSHFIKSGEIIVIHAASGGVGQILSQLAKHAGATVIGLTSNSNKLKTILETGADAAFSLNDNWKQQITELINGKGADVVYDSVGSTLLNSLEITRDGGTVVFYGMIGGDPKPVDPRILMDGSKTITGGDLWSYLTSSEQRINRAEKLFKLINEKVIRIKPPLKYHLSDGKAAHEYLESGKSAGKILLIP